MSISTMESGERPPFVTVVIPVYNDAARLAMCLKALEEQTYPSDCYEVIVVDNGSDEPIETLVAGFPHARAAFEPQPGSYAARNTGIGLARGTVIAFTDADCIPGGRWIEKGVEALRETPNCGLVGGHIQLTYKNSGRLTTAEVFESLVSLRQERAVKRLKHAATANVFTCRGIFDRVGRFDVRLKSSGDCKWGEQVHQAGYALVFAPDALVYHPARSTLGELRTRARRIAGGHHDRLVAGGYPVKVFLKGVIRELVSPARQYLEARTSGRLKGRQHVQFLLASTVVGWTRAWERVRLRFGGTSRRS